MVDALVLGRRAGPRREDTGDLVRGEPVTGDGLLRLPWWSDWQRMSGLHDTQWMGLYGWMCRLWDGNRVGHSVWFEVDS
jgi:hypothetical protein